MPDDNNYPESDIESAQIIIDPKSISSAIVSQTNSLTYNGSSQTAEFQVILSYQELTEGSDYIVNGDTQTSAGSYTATIVGTGNYTDFVTKTWLIANCQLELMLFDASGQAGTGVSYQVSACNYSDVTATLHYTVTTTNSNPGSYPNTVSISPWQTIQLSESSHNTQGTWYVFGYLTTTNSNYTQSDVESAVLTISAADKIPISSCVITLTPDSYTYDGQAKTPTVTVKYNGSTVESSNYSVTYSNNTNAGTATATITATSSSQYTGSASVNFVINKATPTFTIIGSSSSYNGSPHYATVSFSPAGTVYYGTYNNASTYNTTGTALSMVSITDVGSIRVYAYFIPTSNNYERCPLSGSSYADVTVTPIGSITVELNPTTFTYTGQAHVPTITVKSNGTTLSSSNYSVSIANNINAGTATVTVTMTGNYSGTYTSQFTITKAKATLSLSGAITRTYDPTNNTTYHITGTKSHAGRIYYNSSNNGSWPYSTTAATATTLTQELSSITAGPGAGSTTIYAYLVPTNSSNIDSSDIVSASIVINKLSLSQTTITIPQSSYVYTGNDIEPTPTVKYNTYTLSSSNDYEVTYSSNHYAGTATILVIAKSTSNYTGSKSITFQITELFSAITISLYSTSPHMGTTFNLTTNSSTRIYVVGQYQGTQGQTPRYVNLTYPSSLTLDSNYGNLITLTNNSSYYMLTIGNYIAEITNALTATYVYDGITFTAHKNLNITSDRQFVGLQTSGNGPFVVDPNSPRTLEATSYTSEVYLLTNGENEYIDITSQIYIDDGTNINTTSFSIGTIQLSKTTVSGNSAWIIRNTTSNTFYVKILAVLDSRDYTHQTYLLIGTKTYQQYNSYHLNIVENAFGEFTSASVSNPYSSNVSISGVIRHYTTNSVETVGTFTITFAQNSTQANSCQVSLSQTLTQGEMYRLLFTSSTRNDPEYGVTVSGSNIWCECCLNGNA